MGKYTRHVYTIPEIKAIVAPIAKSRGTGKICLFGSYSRHEATWRSDVDLLVECGKISDLFELAGLYGELEEGLRKPIDIVTTDTMEYNQEFFQEIMKDEVEIYG
ncbi:MAG: nucleotidyltransferase domain-containing protein [Clostridiales bacterium]|jgi:predicted nucleotidyltransferase|nr:nucleotidyltransferase domain-containing protein [Clostridiales bacterium]